MNSQDRKELKAWCRRLEIDDNNDEGIGSIYALFRIRDDPERMRKLFNSMSRNDAAQILRAFVDANWCPCEDWFDDCKNGDSSFGVEFHWDDEHDGIVMSGSFRV